MQILIQKWTEGNAYKHPAYLADTSIIFKDPRIDDIYPTYIESVPLGNADGNTITKQWRVGSTSNFTFRTATQIPKVDIITRDLWLGTYPVDFPCFIVYNISKSRDNNLAMLFKVYKLVSGGIETFYIYGFKEKLGRGTVLGREITETKTNGQANFLNYIESEITRIIKDLKNNNDLPNYDK